MSLACTVLSSGSLKHTMIPVEDFTGPTISEIQKFIEITDEARKEGEVSTLTFTFSSNRR